MSSVREAEERCAEFAESVATTLSFAQGYGVFEPLEELEREAFSLSETTRGAALTSSLIAHEAAGEPDYARLRGELREASDELAMLAKGGTTSEEYHRARTRREDAERELVLLARDLLGGVVERLDVDVEGLGARLGERDAVVSFRRYTRWWIDATALSRAARDSSGAQEPIEERLVECLCAFVVRCKGSALATAASSASLEIVQLGPFEAVEQAVRDWRESIGAGTDVATALNSDVSSGQLRGIGVSGVSLDEASVRARELRRVLWDPLLGSLGDAERVVVALDDVVHMVPLDALPLEVGDGGTDDEKGRQQLVGDRWRIETRVTVTELIGEPTARDSSSALVALGGAAFNSEPVEIAAEDVAALAAADEFGEGSLQQHTTAGILRNSAWERGFSPLTYTGPEVREIARLFDEVFEGKGVALVLEKRQASRAALAELAPRAHYLHVATHGWFAPESIAAWGEMEMLDAKSGLGLRRSGEEQLRGMSPMLLCGLALAGANLREDALGRAPGLVTAEELSTLDLSNCELAVLSACDTNVGLRRAGQGVASLQKALQMAGARSVITSLWKVPDEATKELMLDFYRRLWVEKKPKWQALWEAKAKLRNAVDERGEPLYTTRDWAAWVLTGEPQ